MEQDVRESPGVTRGQNVLYQLPHDWASIAHFLGPLLDRVDPAVQEPQLLVIAADAEAAAEIAASSVRLAGSRELVPLAVTSARRATRLLRARPAQIVTGTAEELLALVQSATLKLESLRAIVLAWVDEVIAGAGESALETLLADAPKETARVVVASAVTPMVEALVERYARRARRVGMNADSETAPLPLGYVTVASAARLATLRRVLDDLDPASAVIYTRSDDTERGVRESLHALGYPDNLVRVARTGGAEETDLVVLYDLPATREELREAVGANPRRVVALVLPRQLATLTTLAAGAPVTPLTLSEAGSRARHREAAVREELRDLLSSGTVARELLALEPLLDDYDGIEIAAAALQLLDRSRAATRGHAAPEASRPASRPAAAVSGSTTRLFVNVGAKENARPGDLVGAIVNEAGVPREAIGRVEIRDSHSLVEVDANHADDIVTKLTGTMIKGRRVQARVDQDRSLRPPRREAPRGRGHTDERRGERGGPDERRGDRRPPRRDDRGPRGSARDSGRDRGDRPSRRPEPRGEREDRRNERGPRGGHDGEGRREPGWERE